MSVLRKACSNKEGAMNTYSDLHATSIITDTLFVWHMEKAVFLTLEHRYWNAGNTY